MILPLAALLFAAGPASLAADLPPAERAAPPAGPRREVSAPAADRFVEQGTEVRFSMVPAAAGEGSPTAAERSLREGDDVVFRFEIVDTHTGEPVRGLYPAAWMDRLIEDEGVAAAECRAQVEEFVGGSLLAQAELDLNVYYVLAMNDEPSISVVDPLFGFGGSKLLALVELPSPGEDWVLTADGRTLFVSLPESDRVAVVDTLDWELVDLVEPGERPRRLALQPDGAFLWVGLDGAAADGSRLAGVAVVEVATGRVVDRVATGEGPHDLAFDPAGRWAFVADAGAGQVTVIDTARRAVAARVPVGGRPVSIAYSPLAEALYVADGEGGAIVAVDGRAHRVAARMEAPRPGLAQVRIAPGGRWGFAVNPETDEVHVFDTAAGRVVQSGEVLDGPDQVTFSGELAYLRHRGDGTVLSVPLDEIGEPGAPLPVVDFPGGEKPFGAGRRPSLAPGIVRAPGANAVLVANPADEAIYFYKEGMAAPMGSFLNAGRQPRAVMVVDRSLRERQRPGVYETAARLRRPGRYRIAFFLDSPRVVHCFAAEVAPSPAVEAERRASLPARVEAIPPAGRARAGEPFRARFRLFDPRTAAPAAGLRDVRVLVQLPDRRQDRRPAREVAPGTYEVELVPRAPGVVFLWVESAAQRLDFHQAAPLVVEVAPARDGGEASAGER